MTGRHSSSTMAQTGAPPGDLKGILIRDDVRAECIRGTLLVGNETFHILERPWLSNAPNRSCIPSGTFKACFLPRSSSGRYRNIFWLTPVPARSGILIHNGNIVDHSRGCLIIGKRRGTLAGKPAVLNSRTALLELAMLTEQQDFQMTIIGDQTL